MNLKFESIDIQGFRSIERAKITLENQGTIIVKGINEYEDKATSNGSGKSSIFEAIIYALFEETSAGEKDVENRILGNGFNITLEFSINNNKYVIFRQGKDNKTIVTFSQNGIDISARTKTDTNKLIVNTLGINKGLFLDSIFLSQNAANNLASLQPTARRERLEILTNTDYIIDDFKKRVKDEQAKYEANCVSAQMNQNKLMGSIDSICHQKVNIETKINAIKEEIKKKSELGDLKDIEKQISDHYESIKDIEKQISDLDAELNKHTQDIEKQKESQLEIENKKQPINDIIMSLKDEYNDINREIQTFVSNISFSNINIEKIKKDIDDIKNSDTCPTCGRKYDNIDENHINEIVGKKESLILEETSNIDRYNKDIEKQKEYLINKEKDIEKQKEYLVSIDNEYLEIKSSINQLDTILSNKRREKDAKHNNIYAIQTEISKLQLKKEELLKTENNNLEEYENMIKSFDAEIETLNKSIESELAIYKENDDLVNTSKHILQLITKEFRAYLLKNSLKFLNKQLENYSKQLFSNNGDVIKIEESDIKLDIKLGSAPYESLSGGEKTRVNIALLLAQKALANMIGNMTCNIIILDEILGYCDSQAEGNVIDLITTELESLESIYMISHKEVPIGYDSELIVIKDKNGLSRIKNL